MAAGISGKHRQYRLGAEGRYRNPDVDEAVANVINAITGQQPGSIDGSLAKQVALARERYRDPLHRG